MTKMKDSGIEWIGEVPEEWGICRIKDIYSFYRNDTRYRKNRILWR